MGKPSGFLEFEREQNPAEAPLERIKHWNEFHTPLPRSERQRQGARCMECGVPFCQSDVELGGAVTGCPLHNLIPEWNDLVYTGCFEQALARLLKTSNFPEFTGRVCPALCEAACTCGLHGDSVTVRENELGIIEDAFAAGLITPRVITWRTGKRIAVIGSGPAGLACVDRLNYRGHSVTVFEKSDAAGGLLMYGIPNMKLEKSVVARRIELMRAEGVEFVLNADIGGAVSAQEIMSSFDAVVLCCGAGKPNDVAMAGREAGGIHYAMDYLTAATRAVLSDSESALSAKGRDVVIIGGGDTANDCVGTALRQGCRSVTQLIRRPKGPETRAEDNPWPEWPRVVKTDYGQEEAIALFGRDPRRYSTTASEAVTGEDGRIKELKIISEGREETIPCTLLLLASGFSGCEDYIGSAFGVEMTARGRIATALDTSATSVEGVFAAGDACRGPSLVVWAITEGRHAARDVDLYLMEYTNLT